MASLAELYGTAKTKARQIPANLRESGKGLASWAVDPYGEAQRVMGEYRNMTPEQRQGLVNAAVDLFGGIDVGPVGAIKASHGSPHLFDRFDFSKIGTGEGAQAYGHGGYFAQGFDSPVAKKYQKQLAADVQLKGQPFYSGKSGKQLSTTGNPELDDYLIANLGDVSAVRANLLSDLRDVKSSGGDIKDYQKTLADLRNIRNDVETTNLGHLYNVELKWPDAAREAVDPLDEHHLLDWNAPLNEQSEFIRPRLQEAYAAFFPPKSSTYILKDGNIVNSSEKNFDLMKGIATLGYDEMLRRLEKDLQRYKQQLPLDHPRVQTIQNDLNALQMLKNNDFTKLVKPRTIYDEKEMLGRDFIMSLGIKPQSSQFLQKYDIPGLRYKSNETGLDKSNYVMFDDRFPNIVTRNGVSITDLLKNK